MVRFHFSTKPNNANLINWYSWSKRAFDEAKKQNKPIYLSLSAVWCHWCHVMDETSLSHRPSIKFINKNFIPIRVDSDRRPDIQNRYIMGGWPTNTFLTSEGNVIGGGTYMPPEEFYRLLRRISDDWKQNREEVELNAKQGRKEITQAVTDEIPSKPEIKSVGEILEEYSATFDDELGGFGRAMKFPSPLTLELFMREGQVRKSKKLLDIATITLDNMASGEIYDKEWGGFFRYATKRDWSRPHFEKILSENAQIIMNYLHAHEITKKPLYKEIALKSLDYVDNYLANRPLGGFFSSQDANESFYLFKANRRKTKEMPFIDKTIYADANAQMISTYLEAARILGEKKYLGFALDSMRFLLKNNLTSVGAAHYYTEEEGANIFGFLSDQVWVLLALVDIYEHDPQSDYLAQANDIVDIIINRLGNSGSFFDISQENGDIGYLKIRYKPVKENALLALALQRLSVLTDSKDFADIAKQIMSSLSYKQIEGDFISMAPYALALSEILGEGLRKAA